VWTWVRYWHETTESAAGVGMRLVQLAAGPEATTRQGREVCHYLKMTMYERTLPALTVNERTFACERTKKGPHARTCDPLLCD
jgi:hypothetical protein